MALGSFPIGRKGLDGPSILPHPIPLRKSSAWETLYPASCPNCPLDISCVLSQAQPTQQILTSPCLSWNDSLPVFSAFQWMLSPCMELSKPHTWESTLPCPLLVPASSLTILCILSFGLSDVPAAFTFLQVASGLGYHCLFLAYSESLCLVFLTELQCSVIHSASCSHSEYFKMQNHKQVSPSLENFQYPSWFPNKVQSLGHDPQSLHVLGLLSLWTPATGHGHQLLLSSWSPVNTTCFLSLTHIIPSAQKLPLTSTLAGVLLSCYCSCKSKLPTETLLCPLSA